MSLLQQLQSVYTDEDVAYAALRGGLAPPKAALANIDLTDHDLCLRMTLSGQTDITVLHHCISNYIAWHDENRGKYDLDDEDSDAWDECLPDNVSEFVDLVVQYNDKLAPETAILLATHEPIFAEDLAQRAINADNKNARHFLTSPFVKARVVAASNALELGVLQQFAKDSHRSVRRAAVERRENLKSQGSV